MGDAYQTRAFNLLLIVRRAPRMYASTREALLAYVAGVCEVAGDSFDARAFYAKHGGMRGSVMAGLAEPLDDEWARQVIAEAITELDVEPRQ